MAKRKHRPVCDVEIPHNLRRGILENGLDCNRSVLPKTQKEMEEEIRARGQERGLDPLEIEDEIEAYRAQVQAHNHESCANFVQPDTSVCSLAV